MYPATVVQIAGFLSGSLSALVSHEASDISRSGVVSLMQCNRIEQVVNLAGLFAGYANHFNDYRSQVGMANKRSYSSTQKGQFAL